MLIRNIPTPPIGDVLMSQYPFFLPIYQRGYAWDAEEIGDYVKDIRELQQRRAANPAAPIQHFFGGMVSVHHHALNRVARKHEVVDGQQRLATFTLAMGAIVHALRIMHQTAVDDQIRSGAGAYVDQLLDDFISFTEIVNGQPTTYAKLMLSRVDEPFFSQVVGGQRPSATRESHQRILQAYDTIHSQLIDPILSSVATEQEKLEALLSLKTTIATDCVVIHIVSDNRQQAYRLFSVLNDRGRSLSDGDLLRAYTLELLEGHPQEQASAERSWDSILATSEGEIDRFLRTFYPSHAGQRAPKRDLYDTYRQRFFNDPTPVSAQRALEIQNFLADMANEQETARLLLDGVWPFQHRTVSLWRQDRLRRLISVLRHELVVPLLLSGVKLGETRFSELVLLLERFTFRYLTISRGHPSPLYAIYYPHALSIRGNPGTYQLSSLQNELAARITRSAGDPVFQTGLLTKLRYSDSSTNKREIKYFLSTLESYRGWLRNGAPGNPTADETHVLDIDELTIEHIYPHHAQVVDPVLDPLKHDLANLALWGPRDNQAAANAGFAQKQPAYRNSHIQFTSDLASLPNWTQSEFDQRQRELLAAALRVFRL